LITWNFSSSTDLVQFLTELRVRHVAKLSKDPPKKYLEFAWKTVRARVKAEHEAASDGIFLKAVSLIFYIVS
jgi:hypothetical protein